MKTQTWNFGLAMAEESFCLFLKKLRFLAHFLDFLLSKPLSKTVVLASWWNITALWFVVYVSIVTVVGLKIKKCRHSNGILWNQVFWGVLGTRFGSLELKIRSIESDKFIIGSLKWDKIRSLESGKFWVPAGPYWVPNIFLKKPWWYWLVCLHCACCIANICNHYFVTVQLSVELLGIVLQLTDLTVSSDGNITIRFVKIPVPSITHHNKLWQNIGCVFYGLHETWSVA